MWNLTEWSEYCLCKSVYGLTSERNGAVAMELNEFEIADLQDLILEFSNGGQWDYLRTGSEQTLAEFLPLLTTNTILENP